MGWQNAFHVSQLCCQNLHDGNGNKIITFSLAKILYNFTRRSDFEHYNRTAKRKSNLLMEGIVHFIIIPCKEGIYTFVTNTHW